jgi:hypothetical protein
MMRNQLDSLHSLEWGKIHYLYVYRYVPFSPIYLSASFFASSLSYLSFSFLKFTSTLFLMSSSLLFLLSCFFPFKISLWISFYIFHFLLLWCYSLLSLFPFPSFFSVFRVYKERRDDSVPTVAMQLWPVARYYGCRHSNISEREINVSAEWCFQLPVTDVSSGHIHTFSVQDAQQTYDGLILFFITDHLNWLQTHLTRTRVHKPDDRSYILAGCVRTGSKVHKL